MVVQQIAFDIPQDIAVKLGTGELIRYGGIVRDHGGKIVSHLKEVSGSKGQRDIINSAGQIAKRHPVITATVFILTITSGVAIASYTTIRQRRNNQTREQLNTALSSYMNAIRDQTMSLEIADELREALKEFSSSGKNHAKYMLDPTALNLLADYIREFVEMNSDDENEPLPEGDVVDLEQYLLRQQTAISKAM